VKYVLLPKEQTVHFELALKGRVRRHDEVDSSPAHEWAFEVST
jgi:hypothetical protein